MKRFHTWYSPNNIIKTIGTLGADIYEREILRVIFISYMKQYSKANKLHKICIELSYADFEGVMGRKKYFESIKALKEREVILYDSTKGRKGHQQVYIITPKIVEEIKAKKFSLKELLEGDEIWL
jgi:hypothetical protein